MTTPRGRAFANGLDTAGREVFTVVVSAVATAPSRRDGLTDMSAEVRRQDAAEILRLLDSHPRTTDELRDELSLTKRRVEDGPLVPRRDEPDRIRLACYDASNTHKIAPDI